MKPKRSILVILDDDPGTAFRHAIQISTRYAEQGVNVRTFTADEEAAAFVRECADEIVDYIQDFHRDSMLLAPQGDRFYYEVIRVLTPWARTAIISGFGFKSALDWATRFAVHDVRVAAKAVQQDEFYRLVEWVLAAREPTDEPQRVGLFSPAYQVLDTAWSEVCRYLSANPKMLHQIAPLAFEELVAEIFKTHGWSVELTARTRDHGYDIIAMRQKQPHSSRVLVEAKRYSPERPVGVHLVRALYSVKTLNAVSQAILATSSRVSMPAKVEFARVIPWELDFLERDAILDWCKRYGTVKVDGVVRESGV